MPAVLVSFPFRGGTLTRHIALGPFHEVSTNLFAGPTRIRTSILYAINNQYPNLYMSKMLIGA